jgi:spore photoproduct lyase
LQTTPWFRFNPEQLYGLVYTNIDDMLRELDLWLEDVAPKMLIVGELQDGLVFEKAFEKVTGRPLTHWIVPKFAAQKRHRLIFLTKSTEIEHALELKATPQVVFSWSVNSEEVAAKWERGTPLPSERFAAARKMKDAGWPVRFRLDPMVPYSRWRSGYSAAIRQINQIRPEMVTLGALRATSVNSLRSAAKRNGRQDNIFDFLTEDRDPSGFKYRLSRDNQVELFRFVIDKLAAPIVPALCKEDQTLWRALDLSFRGCHCLLGAGDPLLLEAPRSVRKLRTNMAES